jgi:SagB-type dehydrogenase family enzyme
VSDSGTPDAYGHYRPQGHLLDVLGERDLRRDLAAAALEQPAVKDAPLTVVIAGVFARTLKKYGTRGRRYVHLEAGHVAQNVLLQAVALGLAAVPIGAFDGQRLAQTLSLPGEHAPTVPRRRGAPSLRSVSLNAEKAGAGAAFAGGR